MTGAEAREINRERALRAAGIETDEQMGWSSFSVILNKHRLDVYIVVLIVLLLTMMLKVGVFKNRLDGARVQSSNSNSNSTGLVATELGALSIV